MRRQEEGGWQLQGQQIRRQGHCRSCKGNRSKRKKRRSPKEDANGEATGWEGGEIQTFGYLSNGSKIERFQSDKSHHIVIFLLPIIFVFPNIQTSPSPRSEDRDLTHILASILLWTESNQRAYMYI